jgi:hypothetical protein
MVPLVFPLVTPGGLSLVSERTEPDGRAFGALEFGIDLCRMDLTVLLRIALTSCQPALG